MRGLFFYQNVARQLAGCGNPFVLQLGLYVTIGKKPLRH
jgi:hypothetical protein